jgi:hypothetical protein
MRNLTAGLGVLALFLGWNAPNHYPPWTAFHLEFFTALGVCLLGAAAFLGPPISGPQRPHFPAPPGAMVVPLPPAALGWLLAWCWPLMQFASGQLHFRGDALIGLIYGAGTALSIYIGHLCAVQHGRDRTLRLLWLTLVFSGLAACGLAFVQWLRLDTPGWWAMELIDHRPYANLAQPNHFGLLMVMSLVAVTALFEDGTVQHRWVHALAGTFFGWGVLISGSRGASLALFVLAVTWLLARRSTPTRLRVADVVSAAIIGIVCSRSLSLMQEALLLKQPTLSSLVDVGPRQLIWQHFWTAIVERPWFGYGFNQGVMAMAEVAGKVEPSRNVVFAHNVVLDLMAWLGIPMAVLMMVALLRWMLGWLAHEGDAGLLVQRRLVFAIWLALLVQSLLEFPYAHSYFLLPAALLAGATTPLVGSAVSKLGSCRFVPSAMASALACGATVLFGLMAWDYFQIEDEFRSNRFARANVGESSYLQAPTQAFVLDQLAALSSSASLVPASGMSAAQLEQLRLLARRFHILSTRLDYAKALALNSQEAAAETELQVIRSVCPPAQFEQIIQHWRLWRAGISKQG